MHIIIIKYTTTLSIDNLTLFVIYLIILKEALSDSEVVTLSLLLSSLNSFCKCLMLYLLSFRNLEGIKYCHHSVRTEESHQIILK